MIVNIATLLLMEFCACHCELSSFLLKFVYIEKNVNSAIQPHMYAFVIAQYEFFF